MQEPVHDLRPPLVSCPHIVHTYVLDAGTNLSPHLTSRSARLVSVQYSVCLGYRLGPGRYLHPGIRYCFEHSAILDQSKGEELSLVQQNTLAGTIPLLVVKTSPIIAQGPVQFNSIQ